MERDGMREGRRRLGLDIMERWEETKEERKEVERYPPYYCMQRQKRIKNKLRHKKKTSKYKRQHTNKKKRQEEKTKQDETRPNQTRSDNTKTTY